MAVRKVFFDRVLTGLLLIGIAVVLNAIGMRHIHAAADLTEYKENTIASGTLNIIKKLPDRARLKAYFSKEFPPEFQSKLEPLRNLLIQIERNSSGRVAIEWLDTKKADVAIEARKIGIQAVELPLQRQDSFEQVTIYLGLEIRCADKPPKVIPVVDPNNPEYEIARALSSFAIDKPVVIGFFTREPAAPPKMQGFEMPPSPERIFEVLREQLKKQYRVMDIENLKYGDPIPDEVSVLILAKPDGLDARERFEIDQFIMNGGRAFVLMDRHDVDPRSHKAKKINTGLDPLFDKWGVAVPDSVLVIDSASEQVQAQVQTAMGPQRRIMKYPFWLSLRPSTSGFSLNHQITKRLQDLNLFWASPIEFTSSRPASVHTETLLQSSERAWRTKEVENVQIDDDLERRITQQFESVNPSAHKLAVALVGKFPSAFAGQQPPALTESRPSHLSKPAIEDDKRTVLGESKETRIIIVGDSDFATNPFVANRNRVQSGAMLFLENAVEWLSLSEDLTSIRARGQARKIRNFEQEAMKDKGADEQKTISAASQDELQRELTKLYENQERFTLEARESAQMKRTWIRILTTAGPAFALAIFGFIRLYLHSRERRRLAAIR
ncbi:MAG: GldG family protein [Planctomycetota bacterium]